MRQTVDRGYPQRLAASIRKEILKNEVIEAVPVQMANAKRRVRRGYKPGALLAVSFGRGEERTGIRPIEDHAQG